MALMVFVMSIVLCVFTGFQDAVHQTLKNSGYHLTLNQYNSAPFYGYHNILKKAKEDKELRSMVKDSFESIFVISLMQAQRQFDARGFRALPIQKGKTLKEKMLYFPPLIHYKMEYMKQFGKKNYVIIGREMARYYNLHLGDRVTLMLPSGGSLQEDFAAIRKNFMIAGFYHTGFYEFDFNLIFTSLQTAQRVLQIPAQVTEVIFQLESLDYLDSAGERLRNILPTSNYQYNIRTIREERGNFLAALKLEKTLMMIILSLLIMAGAAGIWITVHLLIRSKTRSIGMLLSMGISSNSLLFIFIVHSMFIGLLASIIGGSLGIYVANHLESLIVLIEELVQNTCLLLNDNCPPIQLIPSHIYYFDHLPVKAEAGIIFGVSFATLVLSGLAGYFPARNASQLNPVDTLRNE